MFTEPSKQIVVGNIFLIVCCVFYLLWWIIAFKPEGAIKGMRSGWLLFPAFVFGIASIVLLVQSFHLPDASTSLFSNLWVLIAGAVIYIVLFAITSKCFHRIVTTELLLIVGWTVLAICEINTLFACRGIGRPLSWSLISMAILFGIISMICYMKYYDLDSKRGWICGMIPLILVAAMMVVLTLTAASDKKNADTDDIVLREGVVSEEMNITSENLHGGVWDTDIANTKRGRNVSPELTWDAVTGAEEYVIYMLDPSAGNWLHWRAHGITATHLDEGAAIQQSEYVGPYPPSGTHTYTVYVFALKSRADSYPGTFDSRNSGIESIIDTLDKAGGKKGNIIKKGSLSGTYTAGK